MSWCRSSNNNNSHRCCFAYAFVCLSVLCLVFTTLGAFTCHLYSNQRWTVALEDSCAVLENEPPCVAYENGTTSYTHYGYYGRKVATFVIDNDGDV